MREKEEGKEKLSRRKGGGRGKGKKGEKEGKRKIWKEEEMGGRRRELRRGKGGN
ncbi:hypothetical protein [Streptococcus pyogenes]|uniref:hypothetical protein n=1 Tax=Streptococcus pyogenes TaxID=1314 RepID=UPI001652CEF4|nr:hypothetical protein [Streptococcus pyogenes]